MPRLTDRRAIVLLVAVQLLAAAVIRPRGEFPVNDDWAFAHSVQWLLSEHRVRLSDWIAMNLLPQTLAGGLVASVTGFSFEALRHLTQVVALLASLAAFQWFRANRLEAAEAAVATLALLAFPAWPQLANSYMSDLYGLVFALPAATLFLKALREPARGALIAATLLAAIGVLQRQVVIVVPFAFLVAWLWSHRPWDVRTLAIGVAPFAAGIGAQLAYGAYLAAGPGVPEAQQYLHGRVVPLLLRMIADEDGARAWTGTNLLAMSGYLGLFLVGWAAWWGLGGTSSRLRWGVLVAGAALAALMLAFGWLPPFQSLQLFDAAGIGPFTLYDAIPRGIDGLDRSPGILWRVAGVGAALGCVALAVLLWANGKHVVRAGREAERERVFLLAFLVGYAGPFIVTAFIDRYLLFMLPFLFALWARTWPREAAPGRLRRAAGLAWIVLALAYATLATRDYFAWTRERWDLVKTAEYRGATPETLDGGFEYNGFRRHEIQPRGVPAGKSWWWVKDDLYAITFTVPPGYEEIDRREVRHVLPRSPGVVRLVRRKS